MSILSKFIRSLQARHNAATPASGQINVEPAVHQGVNWQANAADIAITGTKPYRIATYLDDHVIGRSIRETGHFEEDSILQVTKFIGLHPGRKTFLDIGANIGTHALFALQNGFERTVCIEPDPANFMLLRINQILNGVDPQCVNINAAASAVPGELQFELSETNYGDHRIRIGSSAEGGKYAEQNRNVISVKADTLDSLLDEANVNPSDIGLAWIDTQGHEGHVLAGAAGLSKANVPIVIEFWPYGLKRSGGYPLLREFLAGQNRVLDIRQPLDGQPSISIQELDRRFAEWLGKETGTMAVHTDLLILPRQD